MSISAKQSSVIDIFRCYLPILVVAFHTSSINGASVSHGVETYLRLAICKLGEIAVPAFFVISGYLFFINLEKWNRKVWGVKIKKRVRTLLVPFLIWIVIDFAAKFVCGILKSEIDGFSLAALGEFFAQLGGLRIFWDRPIQEYVSSIFAYSVDISKPIDVPMWYVRDLLVMVLLSPIVWKTLKFARIYALVVLCLIYILFIGFPFVLVTPTALFFFSLGAYFSVYGQSCIERFGKFRVLSYLLSLALFVLTSFVRDSLMGDIMLRLFVIVSVVAVFNLVSDLYDRGLRPVGVLTDSSFFIYASHAVLITEISNFLLWRILPITAEWMLVLKVFLRPAVAVGICLFIFVAMRKICPKTLGALTGGRF